MANKKTAVDEIENENTEVESIVPESNMDEDNSLLKTIQEQNEIIESLKKEKEDNETKVFDLQKQMQEIQSALIKMQANNINSTSKDNTIYQIKCRLINGVNIKSPKGEVERRIKFGEAEEFDNAQMDLLLQHPTVRNFLTNDVIYFVDEENYNKKKVYRQIDLSDDHIIDMVLSNNSNEMIGEFNKLTRNKKEHAVVHSLFYRIVGLNQEGKLYGMTYETRKAIETYFQFTIENAEMLISRIKEVI